MMGYGKRKGKSTAVHDPLWAKALVLRQGRVAWALCIAEICYLDARIVADIRCQASQRTGLVPEAILVAAIHTHSGPSALDAGNWDRPFAGIVTETIVQAWENLRPAQLSSGSGFLYGYSINRRWFDRPVDPGVGVLRVADTDGNLLGLVANFGCHAVVLGYYNLAISADYVGCTTSAVEELLGGTCILSGGGAGDVNPLTGTVRQQLVEGHPFVTMTGATYYGQGADAIAIEDRGGGTFAEAQAMGRALAREIVRVSRGVKIIEPEGIPWSAQAWVNHREVGSKLIETQALGIGDFCLVSQPGEIFSETALAIKARLRRLGYRCPWAVSYANDWQSYLVPETAYLEGGYEVGRALASGHSPKLQDRLWAGIRPLIPETRS